MNMHVMCAHIDLCVWVFTIYSFYRLPINCDYYMESIDICEIECAYSLPAHVLYVIGIYIERIYVCAVHEVKTFGNQLHIYNILLPTVG